jgi:hypothetical protein
MCAHRRSRAGATATTAVALALLLAACGSPPSSVAHLGSGTGSGGGVPSATTGESPSGGGAGGGGAAGGGSGGPQAHSSVGIAGVSGAGALKFAQCVRAHGVPGFPDPNAQGVFSQNGPSATGTPQFQSASRTCMSLLHLGGAPPSPAQQAQQLAALVKYSTCLRTHGLPSYPDPKTFPGGGFGIQIKEGPGTGLDPNSPIFQRAVQDCRSLQPADGGP